MDKKDLEFLLDIGAISSDTIFQHFYEFAKHGVMPRLLAEYMSGTDIASRATYILDDGYPVEKLVQRVREAGAFKSILPGESAFFVESVLKHGFDATQLAGMLPESILKRNVELLRKFGVSEHVLKYRLGDSLDSQPETHDRIGALGCPVRVYYSEEERQRMVFGEPAIIGTPRIVMAQGYTLP